MEFPFLSTQIPNFVNEWIEPQLTGFHAIKDAPMLLLCLWLRHRMDNKLKVVLPTLLSIALAWRDRSFYGYDGLIQIVLLIYDCDYLFVSARFMLLLYVWNRMTEWQVLAYCGWVSCRRIIYILLLYKWIFSIFLKLDSACVLIVVMDGLFTVYHTRTDQLTMWSFYKLLFWTVAVFMPINKWIFSRWHQGPIFLVLTYYFWMQKEMKRTITNYIVGHEMNE